MTAKHRKMLLRISIAALLFAAAMLFRSKMETVPNLETAVFLCVYAVIGWDVVFKAGRNIAHGQVFDENFLMCIASIGAFLTGECSEAVAVILFYQVGELFQSIAVARSRQSITALMDICPEFANVERDGVLVQVEPDEVEIGAEILVKPGEKIPLDGVVLVGESMLDTSALTGEAVPRRVQAGDNVISGCINGGGLLRVQVTHVFEDSTVSKILELVENASSKKAKVENFITRFARYYTPIVVGCAVLLAILPPLFLNGGWGIWLRRACIFLVISCPCALVISVPLSFFGGIGAASRNGVLIKGSNFLEAISRIDTVVFDKTGTLTRGEFKVRKVNPMGITSAELMELAALAECYSDHPVARAIRSYGECAERQRVSGAEEISGHGVHAWIDGREVYAGNDKLMGRAGVTCPPCTESGTIVHVAADGVYAGYIVIADAVKPEAKMAISALDRLGVSRTVMLTGDRRAAAEAAAAELGITKVMAELLPGDKVRAVEQLLTALEGTDRTLAFVGDGINDAPVLTRADVGIAMGSLGSDAAIEAADIVLMDDDVSKIPLVVRLARKTMVIVRQNIVFALSVKLIIMFLGAVGMAGMWGAVFADVGVSVLAILNALRTMRLRQPHAEVSAPDNPVGT